LKQRKEVAFGGGEIIGALGGLIGLGGAEFRLPLLIGYFQFAALEAVILNKAMSLVVCDGIAISGKIRPLRSDSFKLAHYPQLARRKPGRCLVRCRVGH